MFFTDGKDQLYESLMKEKPGDKNRGGGKRTYPPYKYRYADLDCEYCLHRKKCGFELCPEILENIDDLVKDNAFIRAVVNADNCENKHKRTLLYIRANGVGVDIGR